MEVGYNLMFTWKFRIINDVLLEQVFVTFIMLKITDYGILNELSSIQKVD